MLENLVLTEINGEKICQISICSDNRHLEIPPYQKLVFDKFKTPINQLFFPFSRGLSHGQVLDWIMNKIKDRKDITYIGFWENDSCPMRPDYLNIVYDKIKDKETVMGSAQRSQHKIKMDGTTHHIYEATPFFISIDLYNKICRPSFDHHIPRSDTFEEISFKVKEFGYQTVTVWPKNTRGLTPEEMKELHCETSRAALVQEITSGYCTVFGNNLWYHSYFSPVSTHVKYTIDKFKEILES
jgi:hypothetical protein